MCSNCIFVYSLINFLVHGITAALQDDLGCCQLLDYVGHLRLSFDS